ncbi:MAG: TetR/AcrR family transcriptional regulator [Thermoactinomyces sp.]
MKKQEKAKQKILAYAAKKIWTEGYSNVSIADFASELKMSKSTFYKYFASKEDLLFEVIGNFFSEIERKIDEITSDPSLDLIGQIKKMLFVIGGRISQIEVTALQDLKRAIPDAYAQFEARRKNVILNKLIPLFEEGVRQGVFREDLDQTLVVTILMNAIQTVANPEFLANTPYALKDVFKHISSLVIEGNLTDKGRKRFYETSFQAKRG